MSTSPLRALVYLACNSETMCSAQDMATVLDVSFTHLQKAVQALAKAGFVETRRGKGGGNRLARPPDQISIGDVVRALEPIEPVECWRDDNRCVLTPDCALIGAIGRATEAFLASLDDVWLSDLAPMGTRRLLVQLTVKAEIG